MKEKTIKFKTPDLAHQFVKTAGNCNFDVDILYGHILIDGKSTLGVFSLDFTQPATVRLHGNDQKLEDLILLLAV